MSLFVCPICSAPLTRLGHVCTCPGGHSFDVAKEGYVNLLPANRQHSKNPGDDKDMAAARTRFLEGGWYAPLRDALCALVREKAADAPSLLDAGCGEGWYTAALTDTVQSLGGQLAGVDLSKPSVKKAAKRCKAAELSVASLYHLPVADQAMDVVVNCFSPLAIDEFRRVLEPGGLFLYVVPGPEHLMELKRVLYDTPYPNPEEAVAYEGFVYDAIVPVETAFTLPDRQAIHDLFTMTPYCWKTPRSGVQRMEALDSLTVTAQFRIHVFRREK